MNILQGKLRLGWTRLRNFRVVLMNVMHVLLNEKALKTTIESKELILRLNLERLSRLLNLIK